MIHEMAQQAAQQLAKNAPQFEDKVNIMSFGLELIIGSIVKAVTFTIARYKH